ncbi:MAG: hypothetical protein M3299_06905 [Thermoproteota archaeon]|nr:hypothetical protein [Thermoproteota archaeon]
MESGGNTLGAFVLSAEGIKVGEARIIALNIANIDVPGCVGMSGSPYLVIKGVIALLKEIRNIIPNNHRPVRFQIFL